MDEMDLNTLLESRHAGYGDELSPTFFTGNIHKRYIDIIHSPEDLERELVGARGRFVRYSKMNARTMVPGFTPFRGHYEE